jgi:Tfp pilus assembly protein PilV
MHQRHHRRYGFTLVEVVLALGIVVFCLTGLVGLMATTAHVSRDSADFTANTLLFQKVVNQLRVGSANFKEAQPAGNAGTDLYPLPAMKPNEEKTFTVDSLNRFLVEEASMAGDAQRVVNVKILNPSDLPMQNQAPVVSLNATGTGGKVAFVKVTISAAAGYKKGVSPSASYFTEVNLLSQ